MCRNIKQLRNAEQAPTDEEIAAAALQFVRKVSGYRVPSHANQPAFDQAVAEVAASTRSLLASLTPTTSGPRGAPKNASGTQTSPAIRGALRESA